jgi:L-threonylcarbamoyladenylate synthase
MDEKLKEDIKTAVQILNSGGVIAIPTETVYGLACDPRNSKAVQRIFAIKGRDDGKPLQLIASSFTQVESLAELTDAEHRVAKKHWPGPLTLLIKLKKDIKLAPQVNPDQIIGIRITSSPIASAIVKAFGHPIAATSANRSEMTPAVSGIGVIRAFKNHENRPDFVLDVGAIDKNLPTTVASIADDGKATIHRQGAVKL